MMNLQTDKELYEFLANAPKDFNDNEKIRKFQLKNGDFVHCVLWNMHFYVTGTDIVKILVWRFQNAGRQIISLKKFEEGVFSDLRNLKPGIDATLEGPRSDFLEFLYKNGCIRTQKKQKVFFWYSVPHDALFCDALERDLRRESNLYAYSKYYSKNNYIPNYYDPNNPENINLQNMNVQNQNQNNIVGQNINNLHPQSNFPGEPSQNINSMNNPINSINPVNHMNPINSINPINSTNHMNNPVNNMNNPMNYNQNYYFPKLKKQIPSKQKFNPDFTKKNISKKKNPEFDQIDQMQRFNYENEMYQNYQFNNPFGQLNQNFNNNPDFNDNTDFNDDQQFNDNIDFNNNQDFNDNQQNFNDNQQNFNDNMNDNQQNFNNTNQPFQNKNFTNQSFQNNNFQNLKFQQNFQNYDQTFEMDEMNDSFFENNYKSKDTEENIMMPELDEEMIEPNMIIPNKKGTSEK